IASDVGVPTVAHVARQLGLIGNSEESALLSTNKFQMRNAFERAGLNCPGYFLAGPDSDGRPPADALRYPLLVKPVDRSGSMGVQKVGDEQALQAALATAKGKSLTGAAIVEEFVEGVEVSVESISWEGRHWVLVITDKETSGPPHFVEIGHHQPSQLPAAIQEEIHRQTLLGLDALKIRYGASH